MLNIYLTIKSLLVHICLVCLLLLPSMQLRAESTHEVGPEAPSILDSTDATNTESYEASEDSSVNSQDEIDDVNEDDDLETSDTQREDIVGRTSASTNKKLMYLSASPSKPTIKMGGTISIEITGTNTDGSTGNFTKLCKWKSAKTRVASVAGGKINGVSVGATNVSATFGGKSASIYVTVISESAKNDLLRIEANPSVISLKKGQNTSIKIVATYGNGSTKDITNSCTWSSTRTFIATVSRGTIKGVKAGVATVNASYGGKTAPIVVTVK